MDKLLTDLFDYLSKVDNTYIFSLSILPYSIFLYYLYKINNLNKTVKIGFSLTLLFVLITIIFSILSNVLYARDLVDVDMFHGAAEAFLTLSDFVILYGFILILRRKEVNNS